MLNKENYVPWSSRLLWYAKSRPNRKLIHKSILNGPYVRQMIFEPDDELSDKELKHIEADDQAIQTILMVFLKTFMLLLISVKLLRNLVTCSANDERL
nr:hypothetical protein [Tanacetum cinerariifolium]